MNDNSTEVSSERRLPTTRRQSPGQAGAPLIAAPDRLEGRTKERVPPLRTGNCRVCRRARSPALTLGEQGGGAQWDAGRYKPYSDGSNRKACKGFQCWHGRYEPTASQPGCTASEVRSPAEVASVAGFPTAVGHVQHLSMDVSGAYMRLSRTATLTRHARRCAPLEVGTGTVCANRMTVRSSCANH